jgi:C4-dicarboxylate-specific signal transduction histidine kinase
LWINAATMGWHLGVNDRDVYLHTLPQFHCNGWGLTYAVTGMGGKHVIVRKIDGAEILRRIAEQAGRAGKVINSVHDFVRRRDQAREAVSPQALLDAIAPLVNLQARKLQVKVHTRFEPKLPQVLCDRTMVEQVLLNLARNGMQSMDQPGSMERVLVLQVRRRRRNRCR